MNTKMEIPYFLLTDIFEHLPVESLLLCRRVCSLWQSTILSSQRFRRQLFLQPPEPNTTFLRAPVKIHPIFTSLKSDWAIPDIPITISHTGTPLSNCPIKDQYATEPALTTFLVVVPGRCVEINREDGVRVQDVAFGVKTLFADLAGERWRQMYSPAILNGFRQANRMRKECLNRKFIALFRYDGEEDEDAELLGGDGLLLAE
ncbi:hypothetical protein BZA77DRAFT_307041 [Pyronema omphalodes]|nr:hypothetical protein BZA77DRAFT_307041 [Pyronema omphalodes]